MRVKDCCNEVTHEADLVEENDLIGKVMDVMAKDPLSRSVYVVDNEKRLLGIITVRDVLEFLGPQFVDTGMAIMEIFAQTAGDMMRMPVCIPEDEPIEKAIKIAIQERLDDVPVCDKDGRVIGDLNCFEMINNIRKEKRDEE